METMRNHFKVDNIVDVCFHIDVKIWHKGFKANFYFFQRTAKFKKIYMKGQKITSRTM